MSGFTLKSLLDSNMIKGMRLMSGENNLNQVINNVNIIDNPDSFEWFSAGDFLLTTGYVFLNQPESQLRLIVELSELNCSGLGIKIKRYWEEIPEVIIAAAKERNFPIFEIPFTYSLANVSNLINDQVRNRESSELEKYKSINDAFLKCSLNGGDLTEIATIASEMIQNSVILLDSNFQLLSFHDLPDNPFPMQDYLRFKERERVFPRVFTDTFPNKSEDFSLSIKREFTTNDISVVTRIVPIAYSLTIYGYVVVWRTGPKLTSIDYVALESAAQTAALERIKTKQLVESQNKQRDDFYDDLIQGRIISNNALISMAKIYGLNPSKTHLIVVFQAVGTSEDFLREMATDIDDVLLNKNRTAHLVTRNETIFMFLPLFDNELQQGNLTTSVRHLILNMHSTIQSRNQKQKVVIGVSNVCVELTEISRSVNIALDVIQISSKLELSPPVYYFVDLISYHLIDSSVNEELMVEYFKQTLGELHNYDYKHHSDLLNTLNQYFLSLGNVSLTAKKMFIHRNTIIYRLDKIKEILQTDLRDAEKNFNYQMGLKMYRIIQLQKKQLKK